MNTERASLGSVLQRAPGIVWRLSGDRVLTHQIDAPPASAANDLLGAIALVWLALDEPANRHELSARLADAEVTVDDLDAELDRLVVGGFVVECDPSESEMFDVGKIVVFDTTVAVSCAEPLVRELSHGLANLAAAAASSAANLPSGTGEPTHQLGVHRCDDGWVVRWDGKRSYRGPEQSIALYDALINLNHHAARRATELGWAVLHGGAVAIGARVVAMVGHSGAGKSTLTAALTLSDHAFVADEVVAVREDFTVAAFHRPIGLRSGGAERIGAVVGDGPYQQTLPYHVPGPLGGGEPLALVAILCRTDEPIGARFEHLDPAAALFALANQTLGATEFERDVFWRLDRLVRSVRVVELHYHDLADAIALLEAFALGADGP